MVHAHLPGPEPGTWDYDLKLELAINNAHQTRSYHFISRG